MYDLHDLDHVPGWDPHETALAHMIAGLDCWYNVNLCGTCV